MAEPNDLVFFENSLVLLTTAGIAVPLLHRLSINPILSFLILGAALGPSGLGAHVKDFPWLRHVVIQESDGLRLLGDLGIVFLLFLIGTGLSIERLITWRRFVFGLGGLQMLLCGTALTLIGEMMGLSRGVALTVGLAFSLSSTAIVLQYLSKRKEMKSSTGRACFSILLFQDLAIIPVLLMLGVLSKKTENVLLYDLGLALGQAVLVVAGIFFVGRAVVRPLFRAVARTESSDLFVATTLLTVIGSAVASSAAGASMSLGAFIAGLLIAETEYSHAIGTVVEPFKGLFLGLFFFTIGMGIDLSYIAHNFLLVALSVVGLITVKAAFTAPLLRLFGFFWSTCIKSSFLLAPAGEFVFVVIGLASANGLLTADETALAVSIASLTMAGIPLMGRLGLFVTERLKKNELPIRQIFPGSDDLEKIEAMVIGLRRVGGMACDFLTQHKISYIAIDKDLTLVDGQRKKGVRAYFGNGTDPQLLLRSGIMTVKTVVITSHIREEIDSIVEAVRGLRKDVTIISRAHDADHAKHLYSLGVSVAVPETIESSLQLSEAALLSLDRNEKDVRESIDNRRDAIRSELLKALNTA